MTLVPLDPLEESPDSALSTARAARRTVFLETYGCQMNIADSELIGGVLGRHGFSMIGDPAAADVLLLNTCAIREHAEERVIGRLHELSRYKQGRPHVRLGLLGCMASHHRDRLLERAPSLDLVVGPDGYRELPRLIAEGEDPHIEVRLDRDETYADLAPLHGPGPRAFITVVRGCDKFCSFCVVPYTRGRERSLPPDAVIAQVEAAVRDGKREVVFLGQTVNAYRSQGVDFASLLRLSGQVDGLERIRFTSPHPADVSDEMIDVMACEPKVMPYLHLPVQSASDRVLESMRRGYTAARYRALVRCVRARIPGIALSTDVIVGFPGESLEDFQATFELLQETRYDFAYLYKYSRRELTQAWRTPETVDEAEKGRRLRMLIDLQEQVSLERNRELIGCEVEVLVEGPAKRPPGFALGRSREFKTTVFPARGARAGDLVRVRVEAATAHTLTGARV